ncbi:hypothetical protein NEPAR06_0227 [Nematocida parisii]|uniref:uncharacterized protein n=1 Tax=Nematocida parisii (strain ERTm1 / ATCC PRA-289) TaxID=881290 RepID=UPI000264B236|nr:uncharacterized protein NEPG_00625 [Nematocida parisii ERTm1]EIJ95100.1 hypothetical protein NEPG_00625 [Nematocida parisii ERTm1]KAI5153149.1 hypothetical protein NEPAR06_0227 [Nematocida parisii]KAI5156380.1 hypothetical protein NEPAR05_0510 [Nematocida parisii]|eukprot:XP_013058456.1 hypothetical protein NEPG_00625 [Nematocida parisii ERTm1]
MSFSSENKARKYIKIVLIIGGVLLVGTAIGGVAILYRSKETLEKKNVANSKMLNTSNEKSEDKAIKSINNQKQSKNSHNNSSNAHAPQQTLDSIPADSLKEASAQEDRKLKVVDTEKIPKNHYEISKDHLKKAVMNSANLFTPTDALPEENPLTVNTTVPAAIPNDLYTPQDGVYPVIGGEDTADKATQIEKNKEDEKILKQIDEAAKTLESSQQNSKTD